MCCCRLIRTFDGMSCRGRVLAIVAVLSLVSGLFVWPGLHGGPAGAAGTPALFGSLSPARLFDSRPGESTVDGLLAGIGVRGARSVSEVVVAGRGGVPVDAVAVVLNVTVAGALGAGFLTVWPCGSTMPLASNLNFVAGQVVPNAVLSKVGV